MANISQHIALIQDRLSGLYSRQELESLIRIVFRHFFGFSPIEIHLHTNDEISENIASQLQRVIGELEKHCPIQYILGETEFYGLHFQITPDVLIPRPETEELVDWIVREYSGLTPTIFDIGTGSGCIAVSLAKHLSGSKVWAMDVSEPALIIAQTNAKGNHVDIHTIHGDILNDQLPFHEDYFDVIVSNPPYVLSSQKQKMHSNVLQYEPHLALFPSGDDPLIFYRHIATLGRKYLNRGGKIFFEINELYPQEIKEILNAAGYEHVTLHKDIHDKWRMICGQNP